MRKSCILIILFLFFIVIITIIGSEIVTGNIKIDEGRDILTIQKNKELYFNVYGYTLDNPNVIVNPYGNSPLTALVMFSSSDYSKVEITIKGKNGDNDIYYSFDKDKYHYIPVYGLYADYDNTIIIKCEGRERVINIKTEGLPLDFEMKRDITYADYMIYNDDYPYVIDKNGEVRWFLNEHYYGNITCLEDSSIIIGSDRYDENDNTVSFYKINLLGKIYNEYILENGYYGFNVVYDDRVLVLSEDILVIDLQTGEIMDKFINNDYDYLDVSGDDIVVGRDNVFYRLLDDKEESIEYSINGKDFSFYNGTSNYSIISSERYGGLKSSLLSEKNINLIKYKEIEQFEDIEIINEVDRIKVINNSGENIYLILDKFMDKRIYEVSDIRYINKKGLNGKYTIYYKIKNKVYKTDYYIEV